jgi:aryl-alcohol dehydrogenase-like predicted oxidoreductase
MPADIHAWSSPRDPNSPSLLAIGTMNFGKRTPEKEAQEIIASAFERGHRFFDTANAYNDGESERILGRSQAIKSHREECIVATKVGFGRIKGKPEGLAPDRIRNALDESLARLATDYVDIFYLHVPDYAVPIEETLAAMHDVLKAKKARAWGVSNFASWQVLEIFAICDARKMPRPTIAQQLYNALIRQLDIEWFKFTKKHPIHTTIYNPLAGGLLSGKHRAESADANKKGSRFDNNALYQRRYWSDHMFRVVDSLEGIAKTENMTLVELAYAWAFGRAGVDSILIGPGTLAHLNDAIKASTRTLSNDARSQIDAIYTASQGTDASYARE